MWTIEVKSKEITDGLLRVVVHFTQGEEKFEEIFETRSGQDTGWLLRGIQRRVTDLESLYAYIDIIPLGKINLADAPIEQQQEEKTEYENKLQEFGKFVEAIKKGIITEDNPEFIATKQWLKDNFSKDIINFF
jgi:hypothetical protein